MKLIGTILCSDSGKTAFTMSPADSLSFEHDDRGESDYDCWDAVIGDSWNAMAAYRIQNHIQWVPNNERFKW